MKTTTPYRKLPFRVGFAAGLAAGIVATGVMLLISVVLHGISLPEVFGSVFTALTPPRVFAYLHRVIGGDAKHYLFYGILVGQCLVFALSGALYNVRFSPPGQRLHWYHGLLLALILWLLTGFVLLPLTGSGIFATQLSIGLGNSMLSLAVVGLVFGFLFILAQNWLTTWGYSRAAISASAGPDGVVSRSRRALLKRGAALVGIGVVILVVWRLVAAGMSTAKVPVARLLQDFKSKIVPPPTPNYGEIHPTGSLSPEVTSNDQYYVVSKNLNTDPVIDSKTWNLTVGGQVEQPFTLTYQELLALPRQQQYESMMCISNEVGGPYMSNALWEGVPLLDLLQRAGLKPGPTKVVFYAEDDYSDSIHLSKALEPTTLLAVHMNGAPLPQIHGFPARMLVPGIYGLKHVKWVTRIEVVNYDYQGYWQQRGYTDTAQIRLTSRIDTPSDGTGVSANRTTYIAGVAFSGNRGISEVDVSTDAGQTWQQATLKRPLSALTWVLWELAWQPKLGDYIIVVRAVDLAGNVQDPHEDPPFPNGSSGYHSLGVTAV